MSFFTDKQTIADLGLLDKQGSDSIFGIFNRCATAGGATVLEDMFLHPLSNATDINRRSDIFRCFAGAAIPFPFQNTHFDAIGLYLANTDERSRLTADTLGITSKLNRLIAADAEKDGICNAIIHLAELLKAVKAFITTLKTPCDAYAADKEAILALLASDAFTPVWQQDTKGRPHNAVLIVFDTIFRFRHRNLVQKLLRYIYELDVYTAVAKVAVEHGFAFPKALPKEHQTVLLEDIRHPAIKAAKPNSLHITANGNVIFLTGANMAGKSTFMKSVSIALFLAQMGFPVAASRLEFAVFDGIYTTINLPDNLVMGASHFYAEVLRVKKMAQELSQQKRLFIVFDELFRGTNVKDAYEATIAIVKGFAQKRNSVFIVSTHIIEAGEVLEKTCSNVRFVFLPTRMNGNTPVYTYRLEPGITADRHGMVIIHNEGILNILQKGRKKIS